MAYILSFRHGVLHWDLTFSRCMQDWELESLASFMEIIYSLSLSGLGDDKPCCGAGLRKVFTVKDYYRSLCSPSSRVFPWKSIWKAKVPSRVAFFSWTAALEKILTVDNLRRRGLILVEWCCLCKQSGESVNHLLLHCSYVQELCSMVFGLFGIQWVMPYSGQALFECWQGCFKNHGCIGIWCLIPHCVIWCLWQERNARHFEDHERTILELKLFFFQILYDWVLGLGIFSFHSLVELIDFCNL